MLAAFFTAAVCVGFALGVIVTALFAGRRRDDQAEHDAQIAAYARGYEMGRRRQSREIWN